MTTDDHDLQFTTPIAAAADLPYVEQYFGFWAVLEDAFRAAVDRVQGIDLHAHVTAQNLDDLAAQGRSAEYPTTASGVALIDVRGMMMKHASSLSGGTSTIRVRRQLRAAVRDPDVAAILLRWDSPGGTVAGTMDLAREIKRAAEQKPLFSFVEDLAASAAVWGSSQADRVYANNSTALYGSIGTYTMVEDSSRAAEALGVRVHVIKAGAFKAAGAPGTEITDDQLAEWQRLIDSANDQFVAGFAEGRGLDLDRARQLADGRAHPAAAAVELGMLDGVQTFEETLAELESAAATTRRKASAMTKDTIETTAEELKPQALTIAELKAMFPNASAEFVLELAEKGATREQAQLARIAELEAEAEAKEKAHAEEREKLQAEANKGGVAPLTKPAASAAGGDQYVDASGDPVADFDAAVRAQVAAGKNRIQAAATVARAHPDLHVAFLHATNPTRLAGRLLDEKYDNDLDGVQS